MRLRVFVLATLALLLVSWKWSNRHPIDSIRPLPGGLGVLPAVPDDPENPSTPAKIKLGKQLFEDTRLSGDQSLACMSCHPREMAYTEAVPFSEGFQGNPMPRHTPTLLNAGYYRYINWDGKFTSTTQLVPAILANPRNMNLQDDAVLVSRLESVAEYRASFRKVFG